MASDDLVERLGPIASRCSREDDRMIIIASCNEIERLRAQLAAAEAETRRSVDYWVEVTSINAKKAADAEARLDIARKALGEIVNPLGAMADRAHTAGLRLSGEAYSICNSVSHLQSLAHEALHSLHPDGDKK
jgi:hypothetical protein